MNSNSITGLRSEDEFLREYKALSQLIGNLEERSELIAIDKRKDIEQKKVDIFDVNRSISNQIQETNRELDKKIRSNLALVEDLDINVQALSRNNKRMISEFKHVISDIATKKADDLVDRKTKDQIAAAKNLFFKKVLREIVVGNDKEEEAIKILENQIAIKEKLLKKALLGAEHFRVAIEKVESRHRSTMHKNASFLSQISSSLGFGHVQYYNIGQGQRRAEQHADQKAVERRFQEREEHTPDIEDEGSHDHSRPGSHILVRLGDYESAGRGVQLCRHQGSDTREGRLGDQS